MVSVLVGGGSLMVWSEGIQSSVGGGKGGGGVAATVAAPTRQGCWSACWLLLGISGG